ncbi:MAG: DUF6165 family protein [Desulfobacterales bacterium]
MKIDVSLGEVVDKITILAIKLDKIKDPDKRKNIKREFDLIGKCMEEAGITRESQWYNDLLAVNLALWDIEDAIRKKEAQKVFDDEFIALARSVYRNNDIRAEIKKKINLAFGSELIEEKEYVDYRKGGL